MLVRVHIGRAWWGFDTDSETTNRRKFTRVVLVSIIWLLDNALGA